MNENDPTLAELEKWFNSAQDRAQQWFATRMRIVTVIAAIIAAFVLQLDAFALLQRISSNPELRAKLVAHVENLQKEAEKVFQNSDIGDQKAHKSIIDELRQNYPELGDTLDVRPNFTALSEIDKWMRDKLAGSKNTEDIVTNYKQIFAKQRLGVSAESFDKINTNFKKTGIELLPDPYPRLLADDWTLGKWWRLRGEWSWPLRHLLGILISAALLSLGAPFWFNSLKTLTNLRPLLAGKVDKEPTQVSKKDHQ